LWPGGDWKQKDTAGDHGESRVFLACFSTHGNAKRTSYQREELLLAVDQFRLRAPGLPWLVAVRFDDCELPLFDLGRAGLSCPPSVPPKIIPCISRDDSGSCERYALLPVVVAPRRCCQTLPYSSSLEDGGVPTQLIDIRIHLQLIPQSRGRIVISTVLDGLAELLESPQGLGLDYFALAGGE
jgi:hypothetical protein